MNILKKINLLIAGSPNDFALQHRIFTTSCFWISIISVLFAVFSIIENKAIQIIVSIFGIASFLSIYYFSRKKHKYNKWLFMFIMLFYVSVNWFFFTGLNK